MLRRNDGESDVPTRSIAMPPGPKPPAPPPPAPPPAPGPADPVNYAVHGWDYSLYGSTVAGQRVQISLYRNVGAGAASAAWLRFFDDGSALPADYVADGIIRIHAPMAALAGVLTMLQQVNHGLAVQFVGGAAQFTYTSMGSN